MENGDVSKNEIEEINPIESKVDFENIKSKNILKQIFDYMPKIKSLKIIKLNKKIQKDLNIDYKEYIEAFSPIEIEIKPFKNEGGKFIRIENEERKYYHIYFNESKIETCISNYLISKHKVSLIKIKIDYQVNSLARLFYDCPCIESITFKKFYRTNITNMDYMFSYNKHLKEINFSSFNTTNVTSMEYMFYKCSSLEQLDLSNFNTSKVFKMQNMFSECSNLKELKISNFDSSSMIDMNYMFFRCYSLKKLDFSS